MNNHHVSIVGRVVKEKGVDEDGYDAAERGLVFVVLVEMEARSDTTRYLILTLYFLKNIHHLSYKNSLTIKFIFG